MVHFLQLSDNVSRESTGKDTSYVWQNTMWDWNWEMLKKFLEAVGTFL